MEKHLEQIKSNILLKETKEKLRIKKSKYFYTLSSDNNNKSLKHLVEEYLL